MHTNEIYMLLLIVYEIKPCTIKACLLFLINSPFLLFFDNSFPKWLSGDCQSTYCSSRCANCLNVYLLLFEVYFKTSILNPQLLLQQFNHTFLLLFFLSSQTEDFEYISLYKGAALTTYH